VQWIFHCTNLQWWVMKSAYNTCNLCHIITEIHSNVKCHQARDKNEKPTNKNYIGKQIWFLFPMWYGFKPIRQTLETSKKITIMTCYTNSQLYGMTRWTIRCRERNTHNQKPLGFTHNQPYLHSKNQTENTNPVTLIFNVSVWEIYTYQENTRQCKLEIQTVLNHCNPTHEKGIHKKLTSYGPNLPWLLGTFVIQTWLWQQKESTGALIASWVIWFCHFNCKS